MMEIRSQVSDPQMFDRLRRQYRAAGMRPVDADRRARREAISAQDDAWRAMPTREDTR